MSLRNFYRAFEDATGASPAQWVENIRLAIARRLLEQTEERIEQVACKAGFLSEERMRRCFIRRLGFTPAAYRQRYGQPAPVPGDADLSLLAEAYGILGGRAQATGL
jgi:transcriptional regulator GlxA family with amidase domain